MNEPSIRYLFFFRLIVGGTIRWFGLDVEQEEAGKIVWIDRRKRLAIKKFGGIKDSEFPLEGSSYSTQVLEMEH